MTDRPLTAPQYKFLVLISGGPVRPVRHQWNSFYTLERMGLAFKTDLQVYITDKGRERLRDANQA